MIVKTIEIQKLKHAWKRSSPLVSGETELSTFRLSRNWRKKYTMIQSIQIHNILGGKNFIATLIDYKESKTVFRIKKIVLELEFRLSNVEKKSFSFSFNSN